MKLSRISSLDIPLPAELLPFLEGAVLYDSSCSQEARVIYLEKNEGFFLKIAPLGTLQREAELTAWFCKNSLAPEVLFYGSQGEKDLLLTRKLEGTDATDAALLSDPKRLCRLLADALRSLHETPPADCPVRDRMSAYASLVEKSFSEGRFDPSLLGERAYPCAEAAYAVFQQGKSALKNEVLIHGDACLPNLIVKNARLAGFIDLGNGRVGDRHVDLFWAVWSLWFNCKTDRYTSYFLDAYGRDRVNDNALQTVAAAECFG